MMATSSPHALQFYPVLPSSQGCPAGSIQSSLEVTLSYEGEERYLELNVEEPSGTRVTNYDKGVRLKLSGFGSTEERKESSW